LTPIVVQDVAMLKSDTTRVAMAQLLEADQEAWASLSGMMAMLRLPLVVEGVQCVEVEIAPNIWRVVDQVGIAPPASELVVAKGFNGNRQEWKFNLKLGAPRWRVSSCTPEAQPS